MKYTPIYQQLRVRIHNFENTICSSNNNKIVRYKRINLRTNACDLSEDIERFLNK
jgi:hypothetical protein